MAGVESTGQASVVGTTDQEPNPLERKIIRQIEFYFGDRNLPKDKFLQEKIKEDEGWVEMSILLTFNRLKSLSTDQQLIAAALRKSTNGIIEVNTAGTMVRRCPDLPSPVVGLLPVEVRKEMKEKTLYLKGLPTDSTLDQIQDFLLEYGETELISMRKIQEDGRFKGSLFVEFKAKESVDNLLAVDELRFKDSLISVETKEDYFKRKQNEKKERKAPEEPKVKVETKPQPEPVVVRKHGAILHFSGVSSDTMREPIKEHFRQFASVAFVDFSKGDTEGYVRFDEEGGAKKALEEMEQSKGQLCGVLPQLRVLEGEEEKSYWSKLAAQGHSRKKQGGRGSFKRGMGQRRGPKRGSRNSEDAPAKKLLKNGTS